jgi:hypothetical protein
MRGHSHVSVDGVDHKIVSVALHDGAKHTHEVLLGCGLRIHVHEEHEHSSLQRRWKTVEKATCEVCEAVEAGAPMASEHIQSAHTPHKTQHADIPTDIACPLCSSQIMKRRSGANYACAGKGHEFTAPEIMASLQKSFNSLLKLEQ